MTGLFFSMKSNTRLKNNQRGLDCLNCGQPLRSSDNFCSNCGQVNDLKPLSIKQFLKEFLAGFFAFDTRTLNTLVPLLFKPGKVSLDYIKGMRVKYVNPFQLYLHTSIIFFLLMSLFNSLDDYDTLIEETSTQKPILKNKETVKVGAVNFSFSTKEADTLKETQKDTISSSAFKKKMDKFAAVKSKQVAFVIDSLGYEVNFWNVLLFQKVQKLKVIQDGRKNDGNNEKFDTFINEFSTNFTSKISLVVFIMLPVYALLFSLLYFRKKMTYTEHLIFIFNVQTAFFILLFIGMLIDRIVDTNYGFFLFALIVSVYFYKALHRFYGESWLKTTYKYVLLNLAYLFLGFIGMTLATSLAFLF